MYRRAASIAVAVGLLVVSGAARANPGINGYSGRPYFGVADTCDTNCHKPPSTPVPTITLNLPATVQAGSKTDVTLVVNGTRARTSFDAAFSDGVVVTGGTNTMVPFPVETPGEVVAKDPPPSGASGTYKFSFTAPAKNGTITLWVAAMSASGAGTANDAVTKTTRTIMVTGGTSTTPDGGPSTSSSGSGGGSTGDRDGGGGGANDDGGATSSSSGEASSGSSAAGRRLANGDDGGCNVANVASSSSGASLYLLTAIMAAARGRARRRPIARGRS